MNWVETGRFLIIAGGVLVVLGMVFLFSDKIPLGRLPGDLRLGTERIGVYVPVATCIAVSVVITLVVNFFSRR